jgi:hypothetical protein
MQLFWKKTFFVSNQEKRIQLKNDRATKSKTFKKDVFFIHYCCESCLMQQSLSKTKKIPFVILFNGEEKLFFLPT